MDIRSRGTQLLIAGVLFTLAGLNTWRLSNGETILTLVAVVFVVGGIASLGAGGYFVSQD